MKLYAVVMVKAVWEECGEWGRRQNGFNPRELVVPDRPWTQNCRKPLHWGF